MGAIPSKTKRNRSVSLYSPTQHKSVRKSQQTRGVVFSPESIDKIGEFDRITKKLDTEESKRILSDQEQQQVGDYVKSLRAHFYNSQADDKTISSFVDHALIHLRLLEKSVEQRSSSAAALQDTLRPYIRDPIHPVDILKALKERQNVRQGGIAETQKVQKKQTGTVRSMLIAPRAEDDVLLATSTRAKGDELLGKGSFKKAKLCFTLETGEKRVVATCSKKNMREDEWPKALAGASQEIDFLRRFRGDDEVVQLYSWHKTPDKCQMILEYCETDLKKYIQGLIKGSVPENKREQLDIIQDTLAGIRKIHGKGVIHRDLKPDNIFIKGGRAKIADLGLACRQDDEAARSLGAGNRKHFPPELESVIRNPRNKPHQIAMAATEKADAWAAGLIIYQLLTKNLKVQIRTYFQNGIDGDIKKDIPKQFQPLLLGLLRMNPHSRISLSEAEDMVRSIRKDEDSNSVVS